MSISAYACIHIYVITHVFRLCTCNRCKLSANLLASINGLIGGDRIMINAMINVANGSDISYQFLMIYKISQIYVNRSSCYFV